MQALCDLAQTNPENRKEALEWIFDDQSTFSQICLHIEIDPEVFRQNVKNMLSINK